MSEKHLKSLLAAVDGINHIAILPHNNPDPDAIACAVALRHLLVEKLGVESDIYYQGIVGRAENRALLRYLNQPLRYLFNSDELLKIPVALVDTQPGTGNNALPPGSNVAIVIDHHPQQEHLEATVVDVRPDVGSASTVMTEYLTAANIVPSSQLATALFYGIKTDTMGLERGTSAADREAFCYLLPLVDIEALFEIERAPVPVHYFKNFAAALQGARIYDNLVISDIGEMEYPDLVAEMADFLLRMEGSQWVLCIGEYKDQLYLSVRSRHQQGAGELVQKIVGQRGLAGGHGSMAGGQVHLNDQNSGRVTGYFIRRALEYLNIGSEIEGQTLV